MIAVVCAQLMCDCIIDMEQQRTFQQVWIMNAYIVCDMKYINNGNKATLQHNQLKQRSAGITWHISRTQSKAALSSVDYDIFNWRAMCKYASYWCFV